MRHGVALANRNGLILLCLVVDGDAERRADGILTTVTTTDGIFVLILHHEVLLQHVEDLLTDFRQTILLDQRQHSNLDGGQLRGQTQQRARGTVLERLLGIGMAEDREEHAIDTYGGLDDVRHVVFVDFGVEVAQLLAGILFMLRQVEVRTGVDALQLLETERELELDVGGGVGIVR